MAMTEAQQEYDLVTRRLLDELVTEQAEETHGE